VHKALQGCLSSNAWSIVGFKLVLHYVPQGLSVVLSASRFGEVPEDGQGNGTGQDFLKKSYNPTVVGSSK
jgi:hypothetical protein